VQPALWYLFSLNFYFILVVAPVEPVVPKKLTKKEQAAQRAAEKLAEKGKKRVKKDKNAPKKPMSPFFCYQALRRPQIKAVTPEISNNDIIKVSLSSRNFLISSSAFISTPTPVLRVNTIFSRDSGGDSRVTDLKVDE
jgi:hypothetical protein